MAFGRFVLKGMSFCLQKTMSIYGREHKNAERYKKEYAPPQKISIINIFLEFLPGFLKKFFFLSEKSRLFFI